MTEPRSWKPQVRTGTDPKFYGNALAFATREEAQQAADDLMSRWLLVTECRAVESDEPVSHAIKDGKLINLESSHASQ